MKKLFIAASLFLAFAVSAQETQERRQKPSVEQQMKEFENLNLSASQKEKLQALFKEREAKFEKNGHQKHDGDKNGERPQPPKDGQKPQIDRENNNGERPQPPKDGQKPNGSKSNGGFEKDQKEFDSKIQAILTKKQYKKYQENRAAREKNFKNENKDNKQHGVFKKEN
ncbi:MAG: hypothetical protein QM564_03830 [Bergeyella sp.]